MAGVLRKVCLYSVELNFFIPVCFTEKELVIKTTKLQYKSIMTCQMNTSTQNMPPLISISFGGYSYKM